MSIDRDGTGLRNALRDKLRARLRGKAKPIGSLGRLENLAEQIGMITRLARLPSSGPRKFSFSPATTD